MGLTINPLLLESAPETQPRRNWARPVEPATASFAEHMAAAEAKNQASGTAETSAVEEKGASETSNIKPASSWRVNRDAAEVRHEDNDFTLKDFWDVINPLHHIPIVGTIYREMTGDEIKPVTRVAGDILFGAATGSLLINGILSVIGAAYEQQAGDEPIIQVAEALFGKGGTGTKTKTPAAPAVMLADAGGKTEGTAPAESARTTVLAEAQKPGNAAPAAQTAPAVPPALVQMASLDEEKSSGASVSTAAPAARHPYGGVMDTAAADRNRHQFAASSVPSSPARPKGMRIGDKIYVNQTTGQRTKFAALNSQSIQQTSAAESGVKDSPQIYPPAPASASVSMAQPLPAAKEDLGQTMHRSAEARLGGAPLPPELVRDMMLMAIDKYKTASGDAFSGQTATATATAN